jgi:carbon monoxide dehydrogenase subunit G
MDIQGEYVFKLSQERVWEVLRDPRVLSSIIPMARDVRQVSDDEYTGVLFFRVGNIAGTFQGKIALLNIQVPDSYDIEVQGSSPIGEVRIKGGMRLEAQEGQTTMFYEGNFHFGGRIASVGSRMLEMAVRSVLTQSFDTLSRHLAVKYRD